MQKEELIKKLEDIEWEDFEVKEAKSDVPKSSWETVSAFSNTAGGWLIFGVSKKGKSYLVIGINNLEKIEQDFLTTLRGGKFNKKILVQSKKYKIDSKTVLAFYIPSAERRPVYFNSVKNTFIRTGSGDQRATAEEIDAMCRQQAFQSKDKEITRYIFKDLDEKTIEDYRTYLKNVNHGHRYNKLSDEVLLEKLHVLVNGKVTIGGLFVFGKTDLINNLLTDFRIDYLEIMGTSYSDAPTRYNYRLSEEENLFRFYFSIFERLIKKIDIPFQIRGDGLATERQQQVIAIREALVNLLMHTDYFSNMKPRIRVFLDRIEFMNPGALPKDVKVIMKEDFTQPRNPIIARIFRVIKLAENAGTGFDKMFVGWESHYKKKPVVSGDLDFFKIIFPFGDLKGSVKIIELVKENNKISIPELAHKIGLTTRAIEKQIAKLKIEGIIERIGPAKGGYWKVKK